MLYRISVILSGKLELGPPMYHHFLEWHPDLYILPTLIVEQWTYYQCMYWVWLGHTYIHTYRHTYIQNSKHQTSVSCSSGILIQVVVSGGITSNHNPVLPHTTVSHNHLCLHNPPVIMCYLSSETPVRLFPCPTVAMFLCCFPSGYPGFSAVS